LGSVFGLVVVRFVVVVGRNLGGIWYKVFGIGGGFGAVVGKCGVFGGGMSSRRVSGCVVLYNSDRRVGGFRSCVGRGVVNTDLRRSCVVSTR